MNETAKTVEKKSERPLAGIQRRATGDIPTVLIVLFFFAIASGVLFVRIDRDLDPNLGKNWWTLSFETRDPSSSDFTIDNHSSITRFTYTVSHDDTELNTAPISLSKGQSETVRLAIPADPGRTTISVSADDGTKKEIYRER
jgi:hypothetical protein